MAFPSPYGVPGGLTQRLREACAARWDAYCWHPFVQGLAEGTLPLPAFQRYLVQDWLFLIQFARAKALAAFKAESLPALRGKAAGLSSILAEMQMHLAYCADWGLSEADVLAQVEAPETVSYTRWVLDRGMAGDILDLEVALAPCTIGYGEIARRIEAHPGRRRGDNPYESWIGAYASPDYQAVAATAAERLDALGVSHGGEARFASLSATFSEAARLEAAFWQMGLEAGR
ncbi:TenA family protein [Roseomonas marmotae]|uniref:TenA family protein n=1 Tax=Roseomonas marmotae TaxID=2768161 RepID=A0ABS3KCZ2_9PROT|nr:TenA family protein [Roseomonas marmotae]MBO1075334.1 TenA family protein [Roseomonas marmotae]QTI78311.1 TenA family protein [Roseomonas marmotae]